MPLVDGSDFQPPRRYRNGHYATFIPYLFGNIPKITYKRERISTPDSDFLDIDYSLVDSKKVVILCHGLEGSASSSYVRLFAAHFNSNGWDAVAMNYRGCSGEMNKQLQMYNSGSSGDLHLVLQHIAAAYEEIVLVGFSLGGNIVLKYLGEQVYNLDEKISKAIAISTPLHLDDASRQLLKWENILYQWKFLISLSTKIIKKKRQFPREVNLRHLWKTTNLYKFDNHYTAPIFGYKDAEDYYTQNQSINWIDQVRIPSLILNALDDPFLGDLSYPKDVIADLSDVYFCAPDYGGHVGFAYGRNDRSWLFTKVDEFVLTEMKV